MSSAVIDRDDLDFTLVSPLSGRSTIRLTVTNPDAEAVLHVGLRSPAPWLDLYPQEFALAPGQKQPVTAELRPDRAGVDGIIPSPVVLHGQYLILQSMAGGPNRPDIALQIPVLTPRLLCPSCNNDLGELRTAGANQAVERDRFTGECRQCGERIRLCPICGAAATWKDRRCRRNDSHILRTEIDWFASPGGNPAHVMDPNRTSGAHLARAWSIPAFPAVRKNSVLEWSAPIAAFGIVAAAQIDGANGRAAVSAFEAASGVPVWEYDLSEAGGVYPDRGGVAANQELLFAATLDGTVTAIDIIRGVRRWQTASEPGIYGALAATENELFVPAGSAVYILETLSGALRHKLVLGGKVNAAPGYAGGVLFMPCDDSAVYAYSAADGALLWRTETDGPFDSSPLIANGLLFTVSTSGTVYGMDTATGMLRWSTSISTRGTAAAPAMTATNLLVVIGEDGVAHLLDPATGHSVRSRKVTSSPVRTTPVSSGGIIFFGADDGSLYSLDQEFNVSRAYETTPGSRIASAGLALYGDLLYATATNGLLYALRVTP